MIILALDPANVTGVALSNGQQTEYRRWDLVDPHKPREQRLVNLYEHLKVIIDRNRFDQIAFEEASFGSHNPKVQALHNELRGIIKLAAAERGIETLGYTPTHIKKFATGDGRAKKPQMIRAAKTMLGLETDDDNIADAAFILAMAQQGIKPTTSSSTAKKRSRKPAQPKLL